MIVGFKGLKLKTNLYKSLYKILIILDTCIDKIGENLLKKVILNFY